MAAQQAMRGDDLRVGGLTPLSTVDYPGELAAVVFCQGCPWRCGYCQNGNLQSASAPASLDWAHVLAFLERRQGLLDAVVFSGGEPTLQRGLPAAVTAARKLGFKVGLHSAGCYPERLGKLLPQIDWVGLDIKTLPGEYVALTRIADSGETAWSSLQQVLDNGVDYEVRITAEPALFPEERLDQLLEELRRAGVEHVAIQRCRTVDSRGAGGTCRVPVYAPEFTDQFSSLVVR